MDEALLSDALRALAAIEQRIEELSPGMASEGAQPTAPAHQYKTALDVLSHAMRDDCSLGSAVRHLEQHRADMEHLRQAWPMEAGQPVEPLRLSLEEISTARHNGFSPPQMSMNTLEHALARYDCKADAYLGEHGGIALTTGREKQRARTSQARQDLAAAFFALRQSDPALYPVGDSGFAEAAQVLAGTTDQIRKAVKEANPMLKKAWLSGFPAPLPESAKRPEGKF